MKTFLQTFKSAITGRWAISFPTSILVIADGAIFAIERESRLIAGNSESRMLVVVAGELIGMLYLFTAQELLLKNRRSAPQSLIACFFVWISAGLVRGLAASLYAHFVLRLPLFLFDRISNTFLFTSCGLVTVAYFAGKIELDRAANSALARLNEFLDHDEFELNETNLRARNGALEGLKNSLLPQTYRLRELAAMLKPIDAGDETSLALAALRKQTELLAISIEDERKKLLFIQTRQEEVHPFGNILVNFFTGLFPKTISVRISSIIFAFGAIASQIPRNGLSGFKFAIVSLIGVVALLYLFSRISRRVIGLSLKIVYGITYPASFLWLYFLTKYQSQLGFDLRDSNPPIAAGLKTLTTIYLSSVFASLLTDNSRHRESLTFENQLIRTRLESAAQTNAQLRNYALTTHFGAIQGKISSVIMALQITNDFHNAQGAPGATNELLTQINVLLDKAILEIASLGK